MKLLTRRGVLVEEQGSTYMADNDGDSDEARVLRPLQAAACTYRIAFGPRAGQKVLTLQGACPGRRTSSRTLCADINGFSLHAAVRCGADDRQALEQLCRYITRPALANERVQTNAAGQVVLKLKTPWRDGTTHLVMSPLEIFGKFGYAGWDVVAMALVSDRRACRGPAPPHRSMDHQKAVYQHCICAGESERPVSPMNSCGCEAGCAQPKGECRLWGLESRPATVACGSRRADRLGGEESFGPSSGPSLLSGRC